MTLDVASTPMSLDMITEFRRQLQWADIVHYHFPWPFGEALHLLYGRKSKSIVTYHSDIYKQRFLKILYAPLMNTFLKSVDRIVVTSKNYLDTSRDLERYKDQCTVIPLGLDEENYDQSPQALVKTWQEKVGRDFFFFIGVLRYYKGLDVLLDASKKGSFRVVIAGTGPLEQKLKERVKQEKLENVIFTGYIGDADKSALFSLARAVVFPSLYRSEAFGVSLLEGAMHGLPLITTEIGTGTTYVNKRNETGLVVSPGDPSELKEAMNTLENDDELCAILGKNARTRYEELFTASKMGEQYFSLYTKLLQEGQT